MEKTFDSELYKIDNFLVTYDNSPLSKEIHILKTACYLDNNNEKYRLLPRLIETNNIPDNDKNKLFEIYKCLKSLYPDNNEKEIIAKSFKVNKDVVNYYDIDYI